MRMQCVPGLPLGTYRTRLGLCIHSVYVYFSRPMCICVGPPKVVVGALDKNHIAGIGFTSCCRRGL